MTVLGMLIFGAVIAMVVGATTKPDEPGKYL